MALFEDLYIEDSIEVKAPSEKIFNFITSLVDDSSYRAWHPEDHVTLKWIKGEPWHQGSVVYAVEYIHGVIHKLQFKIEKVIPNKTIEYVPTFWLLRKFFPKNIFLIQEKDSSSLFIARAHYRVGKLGKLLLKKRLQLGIASVKQHMKEEGENLKRAVEGN